MKEIPRISDAEWEVLGVLWENSPLTANEVFAALASRSWKLNTVRTFLARLEQKGIIKSEDSKQAKAFIPTVSREDCVSQASESFLERVFGGATSALLVHFANAKKLSSKDLAALQAILDQKKGGK